MTDGRRSREVPADAAPRRTAIAVHGGAGPAPASADDDPALEAGIYAALAAARAALDGGADALAAAVAAVDVLEDDPVFNAGRGAALTEDGRVEHDAAVMEGETRRAGAVAALCGVRHPCRAALAVLEDGRHVLLTGGGALAFAGRCGLELRPEAWFVTDRQRHRYERTSMAPAGDGPPGTVGAVILDGRGHLASATSTGGRPGQRAGRVGDSPLPGAGTWADDATAAVSCTGHGEAIVRALVAHEIDALMRHRDLPLAAACRAALACVEHYGGDGGLIAVDGAGRIAMPFTSECMTRGWQLGDEPPQVRVG